MNNLTLVITTYNSKKYIENLLNNLNSFNLKINILISDDCSTDETVKIINKWISLNNCSCLRIRIIENKINLGLADNRKKIIDFIETKYSCFLDVDDYIDLNVLNKIYKKINNYDIVITKRIKIKNNKYTNLNLMTNSKKRYFKYSWWPIWGIIYKTDILKEIKFISKRDLGEDMNSFTVLSKYKHKIINSKKPIYYHLVNYNSMSNKNLKIEDVESIVINILNVINESKIDYREFILLNFIYKQSFILKFLYEIDKELSNKLIALINGYKKTKILYNYLQSSKRKDAFKSFWLLSFFIFNIIYNRFYFNEHTLKKNKNKITKVK